MHLATFDYNNAPIKNVGIYTVELHLSFRLYRKKGNEMAISKSRVSSTLTSCASAQMGNSSHPTLQKHKYLVDSVEILTTSLFSYLYPNH